MHSNARLWVATLLCLAVTGFFYIPAKTLTSLSSHKKKFITAVEAGVLPEVETELEAIHHLNQTLAHWKIPTVITDYFFKDMVLYEAEYLYKTGDYQRVILLFPEATPENCTDYRICHLLGISNFRLIQDLSPIPTLNQINLILEEACPYFEAALRNGPSANSKNSPENYDDVVNYDICTPENILRVLTPPQAEPKKETRPKNGPLPNTPPPLQRP